MAGITFSGKARLAGGAAGERAVTFASLTILQFMTSPFTPVEFSIEPVRPGDDAAIETLLDEAFGLGRRVKTSYRLREGSAPVAGLSLVARCGDDRTAGAIAFWPLVIGTARAPALLLGPLAVRQRLRGAGIGQALMHFGLEKAKEEGHRLVLLVGDEPYYRRAGFKQVPPGQLNLPGPVEEDRLLYRELEPLSLEGVRGLVLPPQRTA